MEEIQRYDPVVSVVMPVLNMERYLSKSIESVVYQTYKDWELTIIDDGSTDSSLQIMRDYADLPNVRIIVFPKNVGISKGLNAGIRASMGKYYVLCAPDDYMGITALETLTGIIEHEPESTAAVYTTSFVVDENGEIIRDEYVGTEPFEPRGPCTVNAASCIVRMSYLRKMDEMYGFIYDPSLPSSMDWDLWIRLSKMGSIKFGVGEPLTYYRRNPTGMSTKPEHNSARNEVSRRLAFNLYGLPNPSIINWENLYIDPDKEEAG